MRDNRDDMKQVWWPSIASFPVLLVEDKDSLRAMLRHALEAQGHLVLEARDEPEAVHQLRQSRPAVVLTDLKLPTGDGFGVLRAAKELDAELPVVVMTAYGSIQDAVTAMREGATDFLAKPVDPDHLLLMVERAIAQRRMMAEYILLKEEMAERRGAPRIIGEDATLRHVLQQLHRAAATDATVLLEGESGTGKELFARGLHALQPARRRSVCRDQLRGDPRNAARNRAVRAREGRVYRRGGAKAGTLRAGAPRHAVSRRNRRSAAGAAGEDPAGARRETIRARRRHAVAARRRARRGRDQPQPEAARRRAAVPRGSVLPPLRVSDSDSAAARTHAGRRHPRAALRRPVLPRSEQEAADPVDRGARRAQQLPVAGQRPRAPELHRARGHPLRRRHDPAAPPEPVVPSAGTRGVGHVAVGSDRPLWNDGRGAAPRHARKSSAASSNGAQRGRRQRAARGRRRCRSATRRCCRS